MREFRFEGGLGPAFRLGTAPSGGQLDGCARCGAGGWRLGASVCTIHDGRTRSPSSLRGLLRIYQLLERASGASRLRGSQISKLGGTRPIMRLVIRQAQTPAASISISPSGKGSQAEYREESDRGWRGDLRYAEPY
jgi:hypothetical protein